MVEACFPSSSSIHRQLSLVSFSIISHRPAGSECAESACGAHVIRIFLLRKVLEVSAVLVRFMYLNGQRSVSDIYIIIYGNICSQGLACFRSPMNEVFKLVSWWLATGGSDSGTGEGGRIRETLWYQTLCPHHWPPESGSTGREEER